MSGQLRRDVTGVLARQGALGRPRLHLRRTDSTNERARALAAASAPSGTLVTAAEQTAGRGRQGRAWSAPAGSALLMSLLLRWSASKQPPRLVPLLAGVAVCDALAAERCADARVKWPNDVVIRHPSRSGPSQPQLGESPDGQPRAEDLRAPGAPGAPTLAKLAGILVEGRPQEGWAVIGIGVNVALRLEDLPPDVRRTAASLERSASDVEPLLARLLEALERRLAQPTQAVLDAWRARDALLGREIRWDERDVQRDVERAEGEQTVGEPAGRFGGAPASFGGAPAGSLGGERSSRGGRAEGIDDRGRLLVRLSDGTLQALSAGEVHLQTAA